MRILIVEDEVLIALQIEGLLVDAAHMVVGIARDGSSALELAGSARPELCLVDLNLADDTSGAVVARHVLERYKIPSVFVSGDPDGCRRLGKEAALGCLSKPFEPDDLVHMVEAAEAALKGGRSRSWPTKFELYGVGGEASLH